MHYKKFKVKNIVLLTITVIIAAVLAYMIIHDNQEAKQKTIAAEKANVAAAIQSAAASIKPSQASPQIQNSTSKNATTITAIPIPSKALFIGNSLLLGNGSFGMSASDSNHDYYHYITQKIISYNPSFTATKFIGSPWEGYSSLSDQYIWMENKLLPNLSSELDLIVIQLGDNVNTPEKAAIFQQGSITLLKYIMQHCPKADVVWAGTWFSTKPNQAFISAACSDTGAIFIDISDLYVSKYESAIGDIITHIDGTKTTITDKGVAEHPNNAGMLAIANRICYYLGLTKSETEITG
jgi:hypothetical protein